MATHHEGESFVPRKTEKLNIRIDPSVKAALWKASEHDNRSVANMIEVLIRSHCAEKGIKIEESTSSLAPALKKTASKARR